MGARNTARLWVLGGMAIIVLLALGGWFLLIGPKFSEAADVRAQADDTRVQLVALRKKLAGLDEKRAQLPQFTARLRVNRAALPGDSGVPDFLRQLEASGELTGVTVSGFSVAAPAPAVGVANVWQLQMTLNAAGEPDDLGRFLDRLQSRQPRAVLVQSANLTSDTTAGTSAESGPSGSPTSGDSTGETTLSLSLMAFVAPPTGSGAPIVTTK